MKAFAVPADADLFETAVAARDAVHGECVEQFHREYATTLRPGRDVRRIRPRSRAALMGTLEASGNSQGGAYGESLEDRLERALSRAQAGNAPRGPLRID